jgi:hypothetical protein
MPSYTPGDEMVALKVYYYDAESKQYLNRIFVYSEESDSLVKKTFRMIFRLQFGPVRGRLDQFRFWTHHDARAIFRRSEYKTVYLKALNDRDMEPFVGMGPGTWYWNCKVKYTEYLRRFFKTYLEARISRFNPNIVLTVPRITLYLNRESQQGLIQRIDVLKYNANDDGIGNLMKQTSLSHRIVLYVVLLKPSRVDRIIDPFVDNVVNPTNDMRCYIKPSENLEPETLENFNQTKDFIPINDDVKDLVASYIFGRPMATVLVNPVKIIDLGNSATMDEDLDDIDS